MTVIYHIIDSISYFVLLSPFLIIYFSIKKSIWKKKNLFPKILTIILLALNLVLIYARVIEPNIIKTEETDIEVGFDARIILIADIHMGAYNREYTFKKVVDRINKIEDVDFVIVAGDLTYVPIGDITSLLSPLKEIRSPVYTVLGNHDVGYPGTDLSYEIRNALEILDIPLLEDDVIHLELEKNDVTLVGLRDLSISKKGFEILDNIDEKENSIVIAHNPDSIYKYKNKNIDITLSGHTHGGQIRLPFIYKFFIPSSYGFDQGLYTLEKGKVFVSSGLGLTGLPFRLGVKPTIDILNLY